MNRLRTWAAGLAGVMMIAATSAVQAAPVMTADTTSGYVVEARLRNGNTGWEAGLFTPGDPFPGKQLNPGGTPAWSYGNFHDFFVDYSPITGVSNLKVDFNRDTDFVDSQESTTSTSPTLIGKGFKYMVIVGDGTSNQFVSIKNFTINGTNFGNFNTTASSTNFIQTFKETTGLFKNLAISGQISFSGAAGQERPRLRIAFTESKDIPAAVPLPASAWMGLALLSGLAGMSLVKRRQRPQMV